MNPFGEFGIAMKRTKHMIRIYDIVCDRRSKNVKSDWAAKLCGFMGWSKREKIVRIDGQDSLLILREKCNISRQKFSHDCVSELLRAAIVGAVSALDKYLHDLITENCWKLLTRREEAIPDKMKELRIPILVGKKAVDKVSKQDNARPGTVFKKAIQEVLHRDYVFQGSRRVEQAWGILGVEKIWTKVSKEIGSNESADKIKDRLDRIVRRRNQIVHEADIILKTRGEHRLRPITRTEVEADIKWIEELVVAMNQVAINEL